jgi:hypothetical protein
LSLRVLPDEGFRRKDDVAISHYGYGFFLTKLAMIVLTKTERSFFIFRLIQYYLFM